ncbi:MAG: queuosine precursor transporter [Candidatus Dependentiae bacterium]|nr:queuosine precursor transporter [Candidatus Dependentiae bacterium]
MINELIFSAHSLFIAASALLALRMGKEALVAFISVQCILANIFVTKQTTLFGFNATCSDAFTIGAVLGLNLLQEYFGQESAKKAIWTSFGLLAFYGIVSQIQLAYVPSPSDTMQDHFQAILGFMPRIVIASFVVYLVVQFFDSWLYARLKIALVNRHLVIRNGASIIVSQLLDTILFSFLGLYGIVDNILHIIIVSYIIKLAAIALAAPSVALSKRIMNHRP